MSGKAFFEAELISENMWHIYEPGGVYTTLILGSERAMLVDTGYGYGNLAEFVRTLTDLPIDVIITHGHTDHCGGNYQFPEVHMDLRDIPTYMWYETTQKKIIIEKFQRDRTKAGLPMVWPENFDADIYMSKKTRRFVPLKDGEIFDLGGRQVEIIFFPGHTKGSVMVYDHQTGLLISGDDISYSLWIFFDTSVTLSEYAMKLIDLEKRQITGIVASHYAKILPPAIMNDILRTIGCIDLENDREFTHPRTGQKALKHREPCLAVPEIPYVYVVYDKNKL